MQYPLHCVVRPPPSAVLAGSAVHHNTAQLPRLHNWQLTGQLPAAAALLLISFLSAADAFFPPVYRKHDWLELSLLLFAVATLGAQDSKIVYQKLIFTGYCSKKSFFSGRLNPKRGCR